MALKCTIELNKDDGITVEVLDVDNSLKQTLILDGATIVTTVANDRASTKLTQTVDEFIRVVDADGKTSTVTQSSELVRVECEKFEIQADSIETKSTSDTSLTAEGKFGLRSTSAFSIDSSATLAASASGDLSVASDQNLRATGSVQATFAGKQSTTVGDSAASVAINGLSVDVDAGTTFTAKGGVSVEVQGVTATVQGDSSVALRAPSVQLG